MIVMGGRRQDFLLFFMRIWQNFVRSFNEQMVSGYPNAVTLRQQPG